MAKIKNIVIALLLLTIMISCSDANLNKNGTLILNVEGLEKTSKTIEPIETEAYKVNIASYDYIIQKPDNTYIKGTDLTDETELSNLMLGYYNISVYGKNSDGVVIAEGSKTVKIVSGVNNVLIELTDIPGYGSYLFDITWDTLISGENTSYTATVKPISHDGESFSAVQDCFIPESGYLSIKGENIPSGSYIITVKLYNEDEVFIGGIVEAIRISANAQSSFAKYVRIDLGSSMETMSISTKDMVGLPIIATISEELGSTASNGLPSKVTLSYTLTSWNGEMEAEDAGVTVSWYVDTELIGTGNNVEFTPDLSKNRIDAVFFQEAYKGSIGCVSKTLDYGISTTGTGFSAYTPE